MQKLIELVKDTNILVSSTILNFDKPEVVYIPILPNAHFSVKKGNKVAIFSPLTNTKYKVNRATISGKVENLKKVKTINGIVDALEIINDFKEERIDVVNTNLEAILTKYFHLNLKDKQGLILNAIDDEIFVLTQNAYLLYYDEEFLALLDEISKFYKLQEIIIAVKSTNSENIKNLLEKLGMYPNIKLKIMPNLYLLGKNEFLYTYLNVEKSNYEIIKAHFFYDVYNLRVRKRLKSDILLTISGNGIKNPVIMKVKIGTKIEEILNSLDLEDNVDIIINGLMQGKIIDPLNFIITEEIHSILIMKQKETLPEKNCFRCGACIDVCPVGINPVLFEDLEYKNLVLAKCLKCSLCSYICPAYINFNKYIRGEEHA